MSSDDHNRSGRDPVWRHMGPGMPSTFLCPRCQKIGPQIGKRKWRGELSQCGKCVANEKKVAA